MANKKHPIKLQETGKSMGYSSMLAFLFCLVTPLLFGFSQCATVVVDGVSEWKNPHLQTGDSVIFQHKNHHYFLYIFKNQDAFAHCNFTQATLLTNPNSTSYTWHTSRPGFFYFSFNNGSNKECLQRHKFAVKVSQNPAPRSPPPLPAAAPPRPHPVSGSIVASSPALPWSFHPQEGSSPSPAPGLSITAPISPMGPYNIPFITSNPAVPLPTGEADTATIRPLPPTSGHHCSQQVVDFSTVLRIFICVSLLLQMV